MKEEAGYKNNTIYNLRKIYIFERI